MQKLSSSQLIGFALFTGGGLFLEIALTRLLAVLFFPPYVFAVISVAILGIGIGAALASWQPSLRIPRRLPHYTALAGLSTFVLVTFTVLTASQDLRVILFILLTLPYIFTGLVVATLFSSAAGHSTRLYAADLIGAGVGAVIVIPVMDVLGAIDAVLLAAIVLVISGLLIHRPHELALPGVLTALLTIALVGNVSADWLHIDMATIFTDKPVKSSLVGGELIDTRWDSFARTDVVQPANGGPLRVYVDGAAGSVMPPAVGADILFRDIGFFPFATMQPERVLVIGPGAGLDVWFGLQSDAQEIVGVEVNPASVTVVESMSDYNSGLYDRPQVSIVVDEGRSALRRDDTLYDLIFLSQVVTLSAERDGYALVENSVYTLEAFHDYFAHLTDDGQIALKLYDEPTLTRAIGVALETFNQRGLTDVQALEHILALLDPSANIPLLIVSNAPFSEDDSLALGAVAREVGYQPLYLPHILAQSPLDAVEQGTTTFDDIITDSEINISPTTDDRPFFFQFERGIPQDLRPLLGGLLGVVLIGGAGLYVVQSGAETRKTRGYPVYFALLGMGFIAIEIAIIQQSRLFLGHPTYAVTTVLATVLIGSGLGSLIIGRVLKSDTGPSWIPGLVVVVLLIWVIVWPQLADEFLRQSLVTRLTIVVISLLPLSLMMGMPFPVGLTALRGDGQQIAIAWAVNGVMTIAGSVGSIVLSLLFGFQTVLLLAAVTYLLAAVIAYLIFAVDT